MYCPDVLRRWRHHICIFRALISAGYSFNERRPVDWVNNEDVCRLFDLLDGGHLGWPVTFPHIFTLSYCRSSNSFNDYSLHVLLTRKMAKDGANRFGMVSVSLVSLINSPFCWLPATRLCLLDGSVAASNNLLIIDYQNGAATTTTVA